MISSCIQIPNPLDEQVQSSMTIILRFHGELIEKNDTDGERESIVFPK